MKKLLLLSFLIILFSSCYQLEEKSYEIISNNSTEQTKLMQEQNVQLKRIADALDSINSKIK